MAYRRSRRYRRRSSGSYRSRTSLSDAAGYGLIKSWEIGARTTQKLYRAGRFGMRVATLPYRIGRGIYKTFR